MNKLIMFPLTFMFLLGVYAVIDTVNVTSDDYEHEFTLNYTGEDGEIGIDTYGTKSFDLWKIVTIMAILGAAIIAGILSGLNILGSGFNELSQKFIFDSIFYLGLWAALTLVAEDYLLGSLFQMLIWVFLTFMYIIGMGIQMSSPSSVGGI